MNKSLKAELSAHYPDRKEVFETSDGLIHLTEAEAAGQAKHLPSAKIKTHKLQNANELQAHSFGDS